MSTKETVLLKMRLNRGKFVGTACEELGLRGGNGGCKQKRRTKKRTPPHLEQNSTRGGNEGSKRSVNGGTTPKSGENQTGLNFVGINASRSKTENKWETKWFGKKTRAKKNQTW